MIVRPPSPAPARRSSARRRLALAVGIGLLGAAQAQTSAELAATPVLDCSRHGPLTKTFASTPWLLFGCSDNESLIVAAPRQGPAGQYFFMLYQKGGRYEILGRGEGDRSITQRARAELTQLSDADVRALIKQAIATPRP